MATRKTTAVSPATIKAANEKFAKLYQNVRNTRRSRNAKKDAAIKAEVRYAKAVNAEAKFRLELIQKGIYNKVNDPTGMRVRLSKAQVIKNIQNSKKKIDELKYLHQELF